MSGAGACGQSVSSTAMRTTTGRSWRSTFSATGPPAVRRCRRRACQQRGPQIAGPSCHTCDPASHPAGLRILHVLRSPELICSWSRLTRPRSIREGCRLRVLAPRWASKAKQPVYSLPQVYLPIGWSTYFFSAARVTFNASEVARAKAQVRVSLALLSLLLSFFVWWNGCVWDWACHGRQASACK